MSDQESTAGATDNPDVDPTGTASGTGTSNPDAQLAAALVAALKQQSSPSTASSVVKPNMGGITKSGDYDIAWTGGTPLPGWTGLDPNSALTAFKVPTQLRSDSVRTAQSSYVARTTGLTDKFSTGDDLDVFLSMVFKHLEDHGLDTITYLPDPGAPLTTMSSVVEKHARFSFESVESNIHRQVALYDTYDTANDAAATVFLRNSVAKSIYKELDLVCQKNEPFPVVFMRFMKIARTVTIERLNNLKARIKARRPSQYPGQDLAQLANDFLTDAIELESAGHYTHELTLDMLNTFLSAGGSDSANAHISVFRFPLLNQHSRLTKLLEKTPFLDKYTADSLMAKEELTFRKVCEAATDSYRTMLANGTWGPARTNPDAKKPPAQFGMMCRSTGADALTFTEAQANALIQHAIKSVGNSDKNFKSGENKKFGDKKKGRYQNNRNNRDNRDKQRTNRNSDKPSWRTVPPKSGDPQTITRNGRPHHWCRHCGRWSPTHGTDGHSNDKTRKPDENQANHLVMNDFSMWHADFEIVPSWTTIFASICTIMKPMLLWIGGGVMILLSIFALSYVPSVSLWLWHHGFLGAVLHWILLMGSSLTLRHRPNMLVAEAPPAPDPPKLTRKELRYRSQLFNRRMKKLIQPYTSRCRPNRHRPDNIPNSTIARHHNHRRLCYSRLPLEERNRRAIMDLLARLDRFEHRLHRFCVQHAASASAAGRSPFSEGDSAGHKSKKATTYKYTKKGLYKKHESTCAQPMKKSVNQPKWQKIPRSPPRSPTSDPVRHLVSPFSKVYMASIDLEPHQLSAAQALKAALAASTPASNETKRSGTYDVIWDSGASISISPCKDDFVGTLESAPIGLKLQGIAKGLKVTHMGHVAWSFVDVTGVLRTLKVKALLVPGAKARLLSTSSLIDSYPDESLNQNSSRLLLSGAKPNNDQPQRNPIEILIDCRTNIPTGTAYSNNIGPSVATAMNASISATADANRNLSPAEKELLRWHMRLGHLSFKKIQFLMRTGVLAHSEGARRVQSNASKLTSCPLCAACQFGKQKRRPSPGKRSTAVRDRTNVMKNGDLFPGQRVSVDHFVCKTRGRLSNSYGKEEEKRQYSGGAIFVDHASSYLHVEPQVNLNTHETLDAVTNFEKHFRDIGVLPQSYQSDNAKVFTCQEFRQHLENFAQVNSFAGVGAHHHNSVAERAIHTVVSIARTMMLHSAIHWPDVADAKLWNLAVQHAVMLYNHMPDPSSGLSPHDVLTRTRWPHAKFHDFHVWGCPVYVLEKDLADGKKIPKWKARSDRHMFVGMSNKHASSVPLVLNLTTGAITPQFHVVFDDWFATVTSDTSKLPDIGSDAWQSMFGDSIYQYPMDEDDVIDLTTDTDILQQQTRAERVANAFDSAAPPAPLPIVPPAESRLPTLSTPSAPTVDPSTPAPSPVAPPVSAPSLPPVAPVQPPSLPSPPVNQREPIHQRETVNQRESTPPSAAPAQDNTKSDSEQWTTVAPRKKRTQSSSVPAPPPIRRSERIRNRAAVSLNAALAEVGDTGHFDVYSTEHCTLAVAMAARTRSDPDSLSFDDAMRSPEREEWMKAAKIEIDALEKMHCWDEVPIADAGTNKIIPGTFIFRQKRYPDGRARKKKGRFCVRGDLQEDEEDTYAPVVSWSTTRMVLIWAILWGWTTSSIDFSNAFVHAMLKKPIWIHLPRGFRSKRQEKTCLRLRRSLYGTQIAPKLWFEAVSSALKRLGFSQSKFDQCLFYKQDMMVVLYVDDAVIVAKNEKLVDTLVKDLETEGFTLTREGTFAEYLGIKFAQREDGSLVLTQPGLTDKILKATGLEDANPNWTPAAQVALGSDPDGPPMNETWRYSSIVGMLLYLSCNTRPDIAFAVSQVCRFSSNPKQSHAAAVKSIVRYLKRTADKGMILKPTTGKFDLDLYVDADFCGLHRREPDHDPNAAKSREGYIIFLNDCPIYWKSTLISHVCLSTLESEYCAASDALRALLPIRRLLEEIVDQFGSPFDVHPTVSSRVFEDNQGALLLARNHRITNRTKYFLVKWHWFWAHSDEFEFLKIESANQRADFLTKMLPREVFEHNRRLTMGW